jgi:hypothetical protein
MNYKPTDELVNERWIGKFGFNGYGKFAINGRPLYDITHYPKSNKFNISARLYRGISYDFNCQNITDLFEGNEGELPYKWRLYCINRNSVVPNTLSLTNAINTISKHKINTWLTQLTPILRKPNTPSNLPKPRRTHNTPTNHIPEKQRTSPDDTTLHTSHTSYATPLHTSHTSYTTPTVRIPYTCSSDKCPCSKKISKCITIEPNIKFCHKCGNSVRSTGGSKKRNLQNKI